MCLTENVDHKNERVFRIRTYMDEPESSHSIVSTHIDYS